MTHAKRGKYAEGKVGDFLKEYKQTVAGFTYNRITDARSSMGAMSNPQPGDYQWFLNTNLHCVVALPAEHMLHTIFTRNGLIEIKEVFHEFRLPHKNFGEDQVGRMVIRQMAGSECIVLVCHRVEGVRGALWRNVPLDFFRTRAGGSWDLRDFDTHDNVSNILTEYLA